LRRTGNRGHGAFDGAPCLPARLTSIASGRDIRATQGIGQRAGTKVLALYDNHNLKGSARNAAPVGTNISSADRQDARFGARETIMTAGAWHKTACNLCYVNCGIEILVNEGHIVKVRGDRASPKSQGYLCNKAAHDTAATPP
jgi:hypothetical protein